MDQREVASERPAYAFPARGLAWLMHPVEPAEFLDSYWEKRPLEVRRDDPA